MKKLEKSKKTIQTVTIRSFWLTIIIVGAMFFFLKEPRSYVLGYMIGALVSIINFRLLSLSLIRAINNAKTSVRVFSFGFLLRYTIYGIVLILSVHEKSINLITLIAGFLVVKIVVMLGVNFQRYKL